MSKGHSYFELLDELKESGCPICTLVIKGSQKYLDHLMYEMVLDVPMRLKLMDSWGFCNWHAWQIPKLPDICFPDMGFSIFASDLLRKFNFLVRAVVKGPRKKSVWKSLLHKGSQALLPKMKGQTCPACTHVAQFESYRLKEIIDSIGEEELLKAYKASQGICLPHFFLLEGNHAAHPNFPLLLELQVGKSESLKEALDEFVRKQDYRFQREITPAEAQAWRVAMEFIGGKPGVFTNEMGHDLQQRSRRRNITTDKLSVAHIPFDALTMTELVEEMRRAKNVTLYLKQPLAPALLEALKETASRDPHPEIEIVVEDFEDIVYLRKLYSLGFCLYYGLGLPSRPLIFLDRNRGFLLEQHQISSNQTLKRIKNSQDLYLNLLWHRFGNAVVIPGLVKEKDRESDLYCLLADGKRERWFRLKNPKSINLPEAGAMVELFAWDRWGIQVLEVLDLKVLETNAATTK